MLPPPPHLCATVREVRNLACSFYVCRCSTPLADWDLPEDKPDFNTRTNDKLVQNGANQTLSAAGVHGATPGCLLCAYGHLLVDTATWLDKTFRTSLPLFTSPPLP